MASRSNDRVINQRLAERYELSAPGQIAFPVRSFLRKPKLRVFDVTVIELSMTGAVILLNPEVPVAQIAGRVDFTLEGETALVAVVAIRNGDRLAVNIAQPSRGFAEVIRSVVAARRDQSGALADYWNRAH